MFKRILISLLIVVAVITASAGGAVWYYLSRIPREDVQIITANEDPEQLRENSIPTSTNGLGTELDVEKGLAEFDGTIKNILLLGIDSENGVGRSDSMIILTVDKTTKKVKLTSLIRDSYVHIAGRGMDKLNHAFSFGGPSLALRAVNTNFDMNLKDYVTVNFDSIISIVDTVGGVDMKLSDEEAKIVGLDGGGTHHLSGAQTLRYARIRSTSGGDFTRTLRHRKVITVLVEKLMRLSPVEMIQTSDKVIPQLKTSLSSSEILSLATTVALNKYEIEQDYFPRDETSRGTLIKGIYYLKWDKKGTIDSMHSFIFNR